MKILGLCGKKECGKNTTANYLFGSVMVNLGLFEWRRISDKGQLVVPFINEETKEIEEGILDPLNPNADAQQFFAENVWPFCKVYSLADPLKAVCVQILGLKPEQIYGTNDDKNTLTELEWENMPGIENHWEKLLTNNGVKDGQMTAREVMQYVGTEIFRKMDDNVWINAILRRIQVEQPQLSVVCDVRFPNAQAVGQPHLPR